MSLKFNTVDSYLTCGANDALGNSYYVSIFTIFKMDDSANNSQILQAEVGSQSPYVTVQSATSIAFYCDPSNRAVWTGLTAGAWYGLGLACSGGSTQHEVRLYNLDGTEINPTTGSSVFTNTAFAKPSIIKIGNNNNYAASAINQFRYLRVWSVILTAQEFGAEASLGPTSAGTPAAKTANLMHSWPLPNGTPTTDYGPSQGTLTTNDISTGADEPSWGSGPLPPIRQYANGMFKAVRFEEMTTGPAMRMLTNSVVQMRDTQEVASANGKLYANGMYRCAQFYESLT